MSPKCPKIEELKKCKYRNLVKVTQEFEKNTPDSQELEVLNDEKFIEKFEMFVSNRFINNLSQAIPARKFPILKVFYIESSLIEWTTEKTASLCVGKNDRTLIRTKILILIRFLGKLRPVVCRSV